MEIILDTDNPLIVAQEFCANLEANPEAKAKFIRDNLDNLKWLTSKHPANGEPSNFWSYGPEIPNTGGLLLHVISIYFIFGKWRYSFHNQKGSDVEVNSSTIQEVKEIMEKKVKVLYADTT